MNVVDSSGGLEYFGKGAHGEQFSPAIQASELSIQHKLPMADSMILATVRAHHATLWTQDELFEGLERVEYIRR